MNHVWSAPLFGRSTCFFLNYCILTWRNITQVSDLDFEVEFIV